MPTSNEPRPKWFRLLDADGNKVELPSDMRVNEFGEAESLIYCDYEYSWVRNYDYTVLPIREVK